MTLLAVLACWPRASGLACFGMPGSGTGWEHLPPAIADQFGRLAVVSVTDWHINADEPSVLDYNTNFKNAGHITSLYAPVVFRIAIMIRC